MTPKETGGPGAGPSSPESTSTSLLRRVKAREPEAWERPVDLEGPVVCRGCRASGVTADDAPDVVQEVFRAKAGHVSSFRREQPADSFRARLATITRNKGANGVGSHFARFLPRRSIERMVDVPSGRYWPTSRHAPMLPRRV